MKNSHIDMFKVRNRYKTFQESPDSWQLRVQNITRLPYPLAWVLISFALLSVGWGIVQFTGENAPVSSLLLFDALLISVLGNAVIFYEKLLDNIADNLWFLLDESEDKIKKWIEYYYNDIFWSNKNLVAGFILSCICVYLSKKSITFPISFIIVKYYLFALAAIIGFLAGSHFWAMVGFARLFSNLGKDVAIKASIFDSKTSLLNSASKILWKVSLSASMIYVLGVSVYFICPLELTMANMIVVGFFGFFLILYFVLPQLNIHRTLISLKQERLSSLVNQIDVTFSEVSSSPTSENINQLKELFHLQSIVNGKKSWSFGMLELITLIGTVLIPLILFFLRRLLIVHNGAL